MEIDHYDARILAELQVDARLPMAELGRRVHLSQPAVTERVRKLERAGVITGYRAVVSAESLGYGIRAVMRVARADYSRVLKTIEKTTEIMTAYNVTGEDSWIIEFAVTNVAHLDAVVSKFCVLADTSTSIILNAPRENAPIKPPRSGAASR